MKILNPERNSTPNLWKRLESGAEIPFFCIVAVLSAMQMINEEDKPFKIIAGGVLVLMMVCIFLNSYLQRKTLKELKRRYEEPK